MINFIKEKESVINKSIYRQNHRHKLMEDYIMSRTGENIYKRKDGRWEARYIKSYDSGKALYASIYGKSYREAKENVRKKLYEILNESKEKDISFGEIAEAWLNIKKNTVKESTYAVYCRILRQHILPRFKSLLTSELTTETYLEFYQCLKEKGRVDGNGGLSEKTISDIFRVLFSISKYANHKNSTVPCDLSQIKFINEKPVIKIFTLEEQKKMMDYLLKDTDLICFGHLIALTTGVRIGELCGLQWKDINLTDQKISICRTVQRIQNIESDSATKTRVIITSPKSMSSLREIPFTKSLIPYFRKFQSSDNSFILTGKPEKLLEPRNVQWHFKKILKEIEVEDTNFHVLRHTFATKCIEEGCDVKFLSEILGHANTRITYEGV